jgi:hypothetical protein
VSQAVAERLRLSAAHRLRGHARPAPSLAEAVVEAWRALVRDLRSPYRPERHYMRGPGPKWHAKHGADNGKQEMR